MKMLVMRVLTLLLLAALVWPVGAAEDKKKEETPADLAKMKVELARKIYQQFEALAARRAITSSAGFFYPWSRRWMEAQLEVSSKKADQIAAYQAHLDRMTKFADKAKDLVKRTAATDDSVVEPEYYRVEAALWLAKAKGK